MNKIIKSGFSFVLAYSLLAGVTFAKDADLSDEEDRSESAAEVKKTIAPTLEELPPAPTIKDLAERQQVDDATLKKLIESPVSGPYDEYNRSTPRSSLIALALAIREDDYERALNYLDLRNLPFSLEEEEINGQDLVRKLAIVAKRAMNIDIEDLSEDPLGHKDDNLPSYRDRVTTLKTKEGPVDILMQRVPRGDGVFVWKISNATVAMIPALDAEFGYGVIGNQLSQVFPHHIVFGFEVWQIVMLLCLLIIGYAIAFVITFVIVKILQFNQRFNKERLQKFVVGPVRLLIMVLFFRATFDMIAPTLVARALFEAKTLLIIAIVWVMLGVVAVIISRFAERMMSIGQQAAVNGRRLAR